MAIDTTAHAAEMITGEGQVRKYDSLTCLVGDYRELRAGGRTPGDAWVIDYRTRHWLPADSAHFALAGLPTDHMGSGVAALGSREAAMQLVGGDTNKVLTWERLLAGATHDGRNQDE